MSAPTATARGTPAGIKLDDGYRTVVTFANNPTISLWEKTVKPPGLDGGDAVDTTTMHNVTYRTTTSRSLKTLTESSFKCAYDPNCYSQLIDQINLETTITVTFPDGSTLAFFGFLRSFEADEIQEGTQPEATVTFTPTNFDPVGKVEAAAVLTSAVGT